MKKKERESARAKDRNKKSKFKLIQKREKKFKKRKMMMNKKTHKTHKKIILYIMDKIIM